MSSLTLHIQGMSCGHCLSAVKRGLTAVPGLEVVSVTMGRAEVRYDPSVVGEDAVVEAVEQEGYSVVGRARG
jgi:copper chaperone